MATTQTLILGLFFGIIGLGMVVFLVKVFFQAIFGDIRGWAENLRFRKREKLLLSTDELLAKNINAVALKSLRESFFLEQIKRDMGLVEKVNAHHMGILERLLMIADKQSKHLPNLAIVEDLIQSRCELMRAYQEAVLGRQNMVRNRKKSVPGWALDEYQRKIDDLTDRLRTNRKSLESQLNELFLVLQREERSAEITYH